MMRLVLLVWAIETTTGARAAVAPPAPPCSPKACPSHPGRTFCPNDPAPRQCDKPPRKGPCPAGPCGPPGRPPQPPGGPIKVDLAAAKIRWDGLGGLSSGGSTRLLADYPEQQRSDFLDLLFAKKGGAAFQILKTEVGGDGDSSYGSESSTMHTANRAEDNFHEGYETWLLQEAKKRVRVATPAPAAHVRPRPQPHIYSRIWSVGAECRHPNLLPELDDSRVDRVRPRTEPHVHE